MNLDNTTYQERRHLMEKLESDKNEKDEPYQKLGKELSWTRDDIVSLKDTTKEDCHYQR